MQGYEPEKNATEFFGKQESFVTASVRPLYSTTKQPQIVLNTTVALCNMSEEDQNRRIAAAKMLNAQKPLQKRASVVTLMSLCGFPPEESKNRTIQQQIRRLAQSISGNDDATVKGVTVTTIYQSTAAVMKDPVALSKMAEEDQNRRIAAAKMLNAQKPLQKRASVVTLMSLCGFPPEESKNRTIQQQIRRLAQSISGNDDATVKGVTITTTLQYRSPGTSLRTPSGNLSSFNNSITDDRKLPAVNRKAARNGNEADHPVAAGNLDTAAFSPRTAAFKRTAEALDKAGAGMGKPRKKQKRTYQTKDQLLTSYINKRMMDKATEEATKEAQLLVYANNSKAPDDPSRRSVQSIIEQVNQKHKTSITRSTISRDVKNGRIGVPPLKRGGKRLFTVPVQAALEGAFVTFKKIEQAISREQTGNKGIAAKLQACCSPVHGKIDARGLQRSLTKNTVEHFVTDKLSEQESRRLKSTRFHTLTMDFDGKKELLVTLGFARPKLKTDYCLGELVYFKGQKERICNFDESALSLDNIDKNREGRPCVFLRDPNLPGGSTSADKSSYSVTFIGGSNAAGEPLPPHFQLKSEAAAAHQRVVLDLLANMEKVRCKFGGETEEYRPCTVGMNEKGGMNSEELEKYIMTNIRPLYPDAADTPGKRVILKVDSGPGRNNIQLLARLRALGFYLVPGVRNTTHTSQETDQNYGWFKSFYLENVEKLVAHRIQSGGNLDIADFPLLVFGNEELGLRDAFNEAFSKRRNIEYWEKVGLVPFTRKCTTSDMVQHQLVLDETGAIDLDADPLSNQLQRFEAHNECCCNILCSFGYDGNQFRIKAPTLKTSTEHPLTNT